jgi:hypothetical protein
VPFPNQYRRDQARKRIDVIFKKIIAKRRLTPEKLDDEPDLIATLMSAVRFALAFFFLFAHLFEAGAGRRVQADG